MLRGLCVLRGEIRNEVSEMKGIKWLIMKIWLFGWGK